MENTTKTCNICKKTQPINNFYKGAAKCKPCNIAYIKQYRADNIDKIREYDRNRPNAKERAAQHKARQKNIREQDPAYIPRHLRPKISSEDLKTYKARYYQENKERLKNKNKEWAKNNIESVRKSSREWNKRNRDTCNKHTKVWREKNMHKVRAHDKIKYATRKSKIEKPIQCEFCNIETLLHGHHHDYSKPLEVVWLCPSCHSIEHKRLNAIKRGTK